MAADDTEEGWGRVRGWGKRIQRQGTLWGLRCLWCLVEGWHVPTLNTRLASTGMPCPSSHAPHTVASKKNIQDTTTSTKDDPYTWSLLFA
jgi:hypothetical protein